MNPDEKSTKFYAEFFKGYNLKVLIDVLAGYISRGFITFTKNGISMRETNETKTVLFDLTLPKKYFSTYLCRFKGPYEISVHYKYWQKLIKSVKKKDSLALSILAEPESTDNNIIHRLYTSIWSQKSGLEKSSSRKETNHITFSTDIQHSKIGLPEGYELGKTIPASEFQKIKKMTSVSKKLQIVVQRDKFLSFSCDGGNVMGSTISFGELVESFDSDAEDNSDDDDVDIDIGDKKDNKNNTKKKNVNLKKSQNKGPTKEVPREEKYPNVYTAEFDTSLYGPLVKLAGLSEQMTFYSPKEHGFPLKIELQYGTGAVLIIYTKDNHQIEYERLQNTEPENTLLKTTKKGRGRKGQ
jgi:hypothetical protein